MKKSIRTKYPRNHADFTTFREGLERHILPGFAPEKPLLTLNDSVLTQGSCFALNIHESLLRLGIITHHAPMLEILNSPLANRIYLEYALTGKPYLSAHHERVIRKSGLAEVKTAVQFSAIMIFTVGVAYSMFADGQVLFSVESGTPFVSGLTTVQGNVEHLTTIISLLRSVNPNLKIVLTVSPIPLSSHFGTESVFVADCMSKSTLRAAVAEVMAASIPDVFYWPSFEAIRWLSGHMGPFFGTEGTDHRHLGKSYIDAIASAFTNAFFDIKR